MKSDRTSNSQTTLKKKNKIGQLILTNFKSYYKAIIIHTVLYWSKHRHRHKQNKVESPVIEIQIHERLIVFTMLQRQHSREMVVFFINGAGIIEYPLSKRGILSIT